MTDFIAVTITAASKTEAETIARALVTEKLAACVNIIPAIQSVYRWQGQIETVEETLLIAKTRAALFTPLETRVKSLSSYECPCIIAKPITSAHQPYLNWIAQETTST